MLTQNNNNSLLGGFLQSVTDIGESVVDGYFERNRTTENSKQYQATGKQSYDDAVYESGQIAPVSVTPVDSSKDKYVLYGAIALACVVAYKLL